MLEIRSGRALWPRVLQTQFEVSVLLWCTMLYATCSDMAARYDVRLIGDLVSDTGAQVIAADLPTNANLLAALTDASSAVDAALFVGNRYTPAQLASLSDTGASLLRRLVSDLALIYLKRRRGRFDSEKDAALLKEVNDALKALRDG
jgi:phage gp36-like protein